MNANSKLLLAGALTSLAVLSASAELANGIKAIVHDSVITYVDVEDLTTQTAGLLRRQYSTDPQTFQQKMEEIRGENLDKLLAQQLILREFESAGYQLPESVIDEVVQKRIRARFGDRATLTKTLQAEGMTYEKFRQDVREQFIVEAMRSKNISQEIIISPYKIETYYAANKDKYKVEDQVKLRMIVLNKSKEAGGPDAVKLAEEILAKLKEGASFAEMASVYSQGSQRAQGGDWGWVDKTVLRKDLAEKAFALKPGESSGVIETPEACYLMLVEDAKAAHVRPLAEVRNEIEKSLVLEQRDRLEKQWLAKLRKKTFVRYF
jgi:parvulin-like peptidyl-prolyl isomerase